MLPSKLVYKLREQPLTAEHFNLYFNSYLNDVPIDIIDQKDEYIRNVIKTVQETSIKYKSYHGNNLIQCDYANKLSQLGLSKGIKHIISAERTECHASWIEQKQYFYETYNVIANTDLPQYRIILNYHARNIPISETCKLVLKIIRHDNGMLHKLCFENSDLYECSDILDKKYFYDTSDILYELNTILTNIYHTNLYVVGIACEECFGGKMYELNSHICNQIKMIINKVETRYGTMFKYTLTHPALWLTLEYLSPEKYLSGFDDDTLEKYANIKDKKKCSIM